MDSRGQIVTTVGEELPTSFAPLAGIFFAPGEIFKSLKGLRFGLTYRKEFYTHYSIPVNTYLGGVPLLAGFEAYSLYIPSQYVAGLAYFINDDVKLSFDLDYNQWSKFPDPNLRIKVKMSIPLIPVKFQNSKAYAPHFHDTQTYRAGVEWRCFHAESTDLYLRLGYFFDPSPVPGQTGVTNYLDTDRHVAAISPGIAIHRLGKTVLKNPIQMDLSFQYQYLVDRIYNKRDTVPLDNPGYPQIGISGSLYSVGFVIGSHFDFE